MTQIKIGYQKIILNDPPPPPQKKKEKEEKKKDLEFFKTHCDLKKEKKCGFL